MRLKQYIIGALIAKPQDFVEKASRGSNRGHASQEGMPGETSLNVLQGVVRKSSRIYRQHALNCKAEDKHLLERDLRKGLQAQPE